MTLYKCGHRSKPIFMNSSVLGMITYVDWKDSTGYDGDKTECWECYCQRINKKKENVKNEM